MSKGRLKLSYRIDGGHSKSLDDAMGSVSSSEGFDSEPYATGFNFQTNERDLIYEKPSH